MVLLHAKFLMPILMSQAKAALFDLDGVIIDTEPQYSHFWSEVGHLFLPNIPDFAESIKGQTLTNIFALHFPNPETQRKICDMLADFEARMTFPEIPGALDFVRSLCETNIPTAVVTSSNRDKMQQLYQHLPELPQLFTTILTAEDTPRSKPAPDCYINAAKRLNIPISQCLVFEDSHNGLLAAQSSGAFVVGLTTSLSVEEVAPLAHRIIPNFTGITPADFNF